MYRDAPSNRLAKWHVAGWILFSFLIWIYCFRGFISGKLSLQSDAVGYYQHIKFFVDNMVQGVYPFWDPGINGGVPNEFFLRRMGSFNPFLLIPVILRKCGFSHLIAYNVYLSLYYLLSATGFYCLCRVLLKKQSAAYLGFLLILFSSLGTRQFDSYIVLVSVPLIWFFYFFLDFFRQPRSFSLLGMTFCLMNLATTYIPLYFLVIFAAFLLFIGVLFPRHSWQCVFKGGRFAWKHKVLAAVCSGCLFLSMIPAIMIFQSARDGGFVMPRRGASADTQHALVVGKQTITDWAMLEELVYTSAFADLRQFKFAIIYIPGFIYLVFIMGMVVRFNRKYLLLVCWGGFLFLLSVPGLSPVYDILHQHLFIFKYFRNLHWFFWLAMLPIFVLCAAMLYDDFPVPGADSGRNYGWNGFILLVHVIFGILIWRWGNTIWSTYVMIGISAILFLLQNFPRFARRTNLVFLAMTLIVCVQALEVYHYLNVNSSARRGPYKGDVPYDTGSYQNDDLMGVPTDGSKPSLYYALGNYDKLYTNTRPQALFNFKKHKFVLFDRVTNVLPGKMHYQQLERMFASRQNLAFVTDQKSFQGLRPGAANYEDVGPQTADFEFVKSTVNGIKVKTDFQYPRFLVFNQNWHNRWQARINGEPKKPVLANGSFLGLYLPAGPNTIEFHFGSLWYRLLHYGLMMVFYGCFIGVLILGVRHRFDVTEGGAEPCAG